MTRYWLFGLVFVWGTGVAQIYLHPTTGVQNTYSGGCQIHTCSGIYRDNGNTGNYSNNVNWIYRTFCPNQPGMCLRMTFTSFDVESGGITGCISGCYDALRILNGPAQNSPILWQGCGTTGPGTVTSTDPSGCLTTRFCSDGSITRPGWEATISCVPCAANNGGNGDCSNPVAVCSNSAITDYSSGPGLSGECAGCIPTETYTNWYVFKPEGTSGTITLSICPQNGSDDFDFAIFGPFNGSINCNNINASTILRCTYATYPGSGTCGQVSSCSQLVSGASDVSEGVCGDGRLAPLAVTAGQLYLLMINGWTPNAGTNGYTITWGLPPGMSLNCTPLSLSVSAFNVEKRGQKIALKCELSEPVKTLLIEKQAPDSQWIPLIEANAQPEQTNYVFYDENPSIGTNTYRLKYRDLNGMEHYYPRIRTISWYPPNPLTILADEQMIKIQFQYPASAEGEIKVYDAEGKLLHLIRVMPYLGEFAITRDGFPAGIYFFEYQDQVSKVLLK